MLRKLIMNWIVFFLIMSGCAYGAGVAEKAVSDAAVSSEALNGTPELIVPEWYFNFGEVKEGTEYLHEFLIGNIGTRVLEIKKITPG